MTAGYVIFDRQTAKVTEYHNAHRRFRSASVVKILIAIDYLESRNGVSKKDLALLKVMLRVSDDDAATSFWSRGGQGRIIQRMARKLRLTDTAPPPADKPGFWGYTSLSAMDVVKTYRYLLDRADPKVSGLILGHLRAAGQCGSDGFDQYFGIPRAVARPWAVKQGWSGYGSTPPVRCRPVTSTASTRLRRTRPPLRLRSTLTPPRPGRLRRRTERGHDGGTRRGRPGTGPGPSRTAHHRPRRHRGALDHGPADRPPGGKHLAALHRPDDEAGRRGLSQRNLLITGPPDGRPRSG